MARLIQPKKRNPSRKRKPVKRRKAAPRRRNRGQRNFGEQGPFALLINTKTVGVTQTRRSAGIDAKTLLRDMFPSASLSVSYSGSDPVSVTARDKLSNKELGVIKIKPTDEVRKKAKGGVTVDDLVARKNPSAVFRKRKAAPKKRRKPARRNPSRKRKRNQGSRR